MPSPTGPIPAPTGSMAPLPPATTGSVPQPVASRLGPRFYDWQLAQGVEESWRECHLHARNLLGEAGYQRLLKEIKGGGPEETPGHVAEPKAPYAPRDPQLKIFE